MSKYGTAIPATRLGGGTRNDRPTGGGYRYRGIPGWNPAAVLESMPPSPPRISRKKLRRYTPETLERPCPHCGVPAGRRCHGPTGGHLGQPHYDRWAGEA